MPEVLQDGGQPISQNTSGSPRTAGHSMLTIPKNRSTGNLPQDSANAQSASRVRFSMDGTRSVELDSMARSPIMPEHEHGLGSSGLRRIRQGGLSRVSTMPNSSEPSLTSLPRSSSMTLSLTSSKTFTPAAPVSPSFNSSEDLTRFPSESLHSFSFAHQPEDFLHNRQSVIRKSIDFMREKTGLAGKQLGLVNAQAKVNGDLEVQSMMELISRAKGLNVDESGGLDILGPLTGPAHTDESNIFESHFLKRSESPDQMKSPKSPALSEDPDSPMHQSQPSPSRLRTDSTGRMGLRRTYTDTTRLSLQTKLVDALTRPYKLQDQMMDSTLLSPTVIPSLGNPLNVSQPTSHSHRWAPAAQAIFTTGAKAPWTILAANDLACLVFGVTRAEVRKLGILEVVREDRRQWLEGKLGLPGSEATAKHKASVSKSRQTSPSPSTNLTMRGGITALLLSKPSSRQAASQRSQTDDGSGASYDKSKPKKGSPNHASSKSRGVLLCGDVVPIQKRNGSTGSASLWVKEKKGGLIWVVEEIVEDTVFLTLDELGRVLSASGNVQSIWGEQASLERMDIRKLVPRVPLTTGFPKTVDYKCIIKVEHYTAKNLEGHNVPISITTKPSLGESRISSFPHIAGILVLNQELLIQSSNSAFSAALFGQKNPDGFHITDLIPNFAKLLDVLTEVDEVDLVDGIVIPEQSFRRARDLLAYRQGGQEAAANFLRASGLSAKHRDGSEIYVDVQMRVVKSDPSTATESSIIEERSEDSETELDAVQSSSEVVYALWITYSRNFHTAVRPGGPASPLISRPGTPPRQPSPGQSISIIDAPHPMADEAMSPTTIISQQIREAADAPISTKPNQQPVIEIKAEPSLVSEAPKKKTIADFVILEDMGQGAYGQVKLARYKNDLGSKVVLKYVTKKRILVDTWTRDRRLGTVPLEIHVLDYLRRDGLKHPNIVEMTDFFEDNINYYIEMVPHGLPGMDLFDYIEMRSTMEESECKNIFLQVVAALYHLHTKALVVHRDIKDENIVLNGDNQVKLVDFGSAAYIKSAPFDVFVGTIDYAAPEVLQGKSYRGKEQDVWALGILLYTLVYKENPFYSVDEILDRELRVPWVMSEGSIDLIRGMLNRDVEQRLSIEDVRDHAWCKQGGEGEGRVS